MRFSQSSPAEAGLASAGGATAAGGLASVRAGVRNNFDILRFVLASLVVLSHAYPLATGNEDHEPLALLTGRQLTLGSFAVDGFFIISGFLIARSWASRPDWRVFIEKRVRRIYPGFLVAATLGAFVLVPMFSTAGTSALTWRFVGGFIPQALRLIASEPTSSFPMNPAGGSVNGSLWSIPYEFWCYVGVMACGLAGVLHRRRLLWGALAVAIGISLAFAVFKIGLSGGIVGRIFGYPPFWARLLPYFLVGMAFHASREVLPLNARGAVVCALLLAVAARLPHGMIVVLPVAGAYLLLWLAILPSPRWVSGFAAHGDLSYGIYLYSFPILQVAMALHGAPWSPLGLFAVAWPASMLAAAASWHLIERRFVHGARPAVPRTASIARA